MAAVWDDKGLPARCGWPRQGRAAAAAGFRAAAARAMDSSSARTLLWALMTRLRHCSAALWKLASVAGDGGRGLCCIEDCPGAAVLGGVGAVRLDLYRDHGGYGQRRLFLDGGSGCRGGASRRGLVAAAGLGILGGRLGRLFCLGSVLRDVSVDAGCCRGRGVFRLTAGGGIFPASDPGGVIRPAFLQAALPFSR